MQFQPDTRRRRKGNPRKPFDLLLVIGSGEAKTRAQLRQSVPCDHAAEPLSEAVSSAERKRKISAARQVPSPIPALRMKLIGLGEESRRTTQRPDTDKENRADGELPDPVALLLGRELRVKGSASVWRATAVSLPMCLQPIAS